MLSWQKQQQQAYMSESLLIPITNVYGKSDYSAEVLVGSPPQKVNMVLDTGSSTFAVSKTAYSPEKDKSLTATPLAQDEIYGVGGWYGPVVKTQVGMASASKEIDLADVSVAIMETAHETLAEGIIGLAYSGLNKGYDLTQYYKNNQLTPELTYPWQLAEQDQADNVQQFRQLLHHFEHIDVEPYFTQLEQHKLVADQFAFYVHRSRVLQAEGQQTPEALAEHPLNQGLFVLGKPHQHQHLYQGELNTIEVLHDKYYNVNLVSIQVEGQAPISAPALAEKDKRGYITNGIIDSGAAGIVLPTTLFEQLLDGLIKHNENFAPLLAPYQKGSVEPVGIDMQTLKLADWPNLHFTFTGPHNTETQLTIAPSEYWQIHSPKTGQAVFTFLTLPNWPNQSILGLPLISSYYTIFDRATGDNGCIHFAEKSQ